jgi:hypothetical protein
MRQLLTESFLQVEEAGLPAYADARVAEIGLVVPESFRNQVLENLATLQAHARRVSAALEDMGGASSRRVEEGSQGTAAPSEARRI